MARPAPENGLSAPLQSFGSRTYAIASEADDSDIRTLIAAETMAGWIELSFHREPKYLTNAGIGAEHHAIVARNRKSGAAIGVCSLTRRIGFIDGTARPIGYLSELRLAAAKGQPRARIVHEGFAALKDLLHDPSQTPFYLTAILEKNKTAQRFLEAGHKTVPRYEFLCGLTTYALNTHRPPRTVPTADGVAITLARACDRSAIAEFLCRELSRFQFAPRWSKEQIAACPGLKTEDFLLAWRGPTIIGCLALWDQRTFRQMTVRDYTFPIRHLRGLINSIAPLTGQPRLPRKGDMLAQAFLSHFAVEQDDWAVASALIDAAISLAQKRGIDLALIGLGDEHPLKNTFEKDRKARPYCSRLYLVSWPEDKVHIERSAKYPIHVEVAVL